MSRSRCLTCHSRDHTTCFRSLLLECGAPQIRNTCRIKSGCLRSGANFTISHSARTFFSIIFMGQKWSDASLASAVVFRLVVYAPHLACFLPVLHVAAHFFKIHLGPWIDCASCCK